MLKKREVMNMRSVTPMRAAKIGYIVMSSLFCVLGAVLLFTPDASALWIGRLLGIGMIVFGAVKLVGYFSRDLFRLAFEYDLAFGLLLIALGAVTLAHPSDAMSFLCVLLGIPVLADGLFKLQLAGEAKTLGVWSWIGLGVLAILTCAAGVLLIIHPWAGARTIVMVMGVSLFMDGVLNLAAALSAAYIARAKRPDSVDVRYHRVDE